jgi:tetratricopeptide (TPR) repeat protein
VLARIRTHILAEEGSRLAIYGLGGCGKTALALESAYWTKEQRPIRAIFWVPAMSRESFEQAYYEIATCLRLPGIDDPQVDFQQLMKTKLSDEEFGAWLIVVDNADNTGVLFDGVEGSRLIDYLPRSQRGSIIFTTRTRAAATELARDNVIALGELQRAEAVEMLDRRLLHEHRHHLRESGTVDRFLEMLYFHALAIVQAVAFINTNDVTISDYIELYGHSEGDAMDLLNEEFDDQGRYMEATNSVATTWYISFEHVQKRDAIAADHLFFMACVANNDVVATMFPPLYSKTEHVKAMGTLKAYAFVTERQPRTDKLQGQTKSQHKTFDVHPLVHLAIRGWLKAHCQWTLWIETTLARLITIVPYGDHDTQDHWKAYMNHSMHVIGLPEVQELEGRMTLLERIGRCEWSLGRYRAAERAYRQAYEQRLAMSGREHPDTLMTMGNIALMLGCLDKWEEAENMHREELTLTKKVLGDQHPHTLTSQGNLALAVLGQWRYMEAGQMYGEMLPLQKEVLGEKHPDTMTTMQNLGAALRGLGDHAGAEQMHREALALRREVQGDEHADTLSTLCALGTALRAQCKYAEAEEIHREELALRKRVLGEEHPDTVTSMRKLGNILCSREKHIEAEEMQKTALEISEKVSGKDNPATLACRSAVAHILHSQGKYAESEEIHRGTLAAKEKVLGKEHRDTLMSVYWLAELSHDQMRYQDALGLYERAYNGFLRTFGPDHPTAKECLVHLTWVKRAVEEDRAAETAKAARAQEEAVKDVHVTATTSASTLSEQRTSSQVSSRPRGKWRARLHQIVKKSG